MFAWPYVWRAAFPTVFANVRAQNAATECVKEYVRWHTHSDREFATHSDNSAMLCVPLCDGDTKYSSCSVWMSNYANAAIDGNAAGADVWKTSCHRKEQFDGRQSGEHKQRAYANPIYANVLLRHSVWCVCVFCFRLVHAIAIDLQFIPLDGRHTKSARQCLSPTEPGRAVKTYGDKITHENTMLQ